MRPLIPDTDSLDYESADEAVSLKTGPETPAEENPLNETLGLDALANKLSNLYLNSPNARKKPPAFHTEDSLNANVAQPLFNESDSDISFNASFIEVLNHSVDVGLGQAKSEPVSAPSEETKPEAAEVAVAVEATPEITAEVVAPEEQTAESKPVEEPADHENKLEDSNPTETVPVVTPSPKEDAICSSEPTKNLAEASEQLQQIKSLATLAENAAPCELLAEEDESTVTEEVSLVTQNQPAEESVLEHTFEVESKPDTSTPKSSYEDSDKTEPAAVIVEAEEKNEADVDKVPVILVSTETDKKTVEESSEQSLQLEQPKPEDPRPEELKLEELKLEDPKSEELKVDEPKPEEFSHTVETFEPVVVQPEEPKPEEPKQEALKPEELNQVPPPLEKAVEEQKDQQLEQIPEVNQPEPIKNSETTEAEKEKAGVLKEQPPSVDDQQLPIKSTFSEAEAFEKQVSEPAPVLEVAVPEPIADEPKPVAPEENTIDSSGFVIEFATKPKKAIPARFRTGKSAKEHIPKEDQSSPVQPRDVDSEPEKEVSVEKPFEERLVSSAPVFVQHTRGGYTPHKDLLISSTGSLSELLDLCEKQQRNLDVDDELDKKVKVVEEPNELEQLLASGANLICEELNASFDEIHDTMSENEVPVTPPRRSRSPRKASPARNAALDLEDPFKTKSLFANSPLAQKMDGTSSPMTSSSESAIVSSRITMVSTFGAD